MFVTFEGIDRSGKTTQAALLAAALGPDALLIREPGGTDAGERMRELLKDPRVELDPRAELLLFLAARAELASRVIEPAIREGRDVVCDRFVDSTAAYQGAARGLGLELVERLNAFVASACMPDLTVLLRVDPRAAEERGQRRLAAGAADGDDRFEAEGLSFQLAVAEAYEEIAGRNPERIVAVDASAPADRVHARVLALVEERR